ncbi:MAG: indolepyruvate ferredoxin oxidoreductase subunit alpha, partial [Bacteroidetes bacterium]|nr:indolepyruvate ferredoxin oxidoreductase subunit alpha [Bacteroidota bacterium]
MSTVKKQLLTGNEAVARGVYEAGCHISSAYPGTPSTEIQENIGMYKEIYAEWAPNEKVALEVAAGAAMAGACAFASMKHVGLNVAADPLFTAAYTGVTGSLVINTSDEPGMHSSQNEQDNRLYAVHAKLPLIVPSDSQECLDFVKEAFIISEKFDTPVLFRT